MTACSSSDDRSAEVQPIESILASPIQIVDITADGATVRVDTSIDVVCSVVFGVDQAYGGQSTDLDMAGRGHSTHSPRLQGLEADTVYHFRLQGTSADGRFFASEDMTFTTASSTVAESDPRTNLASLSQGATVQDASSQIGNSPTWRPENAIDGDADTEWSSAGDGDDAFITVELSRSTELAVIGLWTRTMGNSAQISSFLVVTDDGTELGPFDVPDGARLYEFPVSVTTRTLRFEVVSSSGGNTGLIEIAAFAAD